MKKFWRNMLSGYFLVILVLLLEIGVIVAVTVFLDDIIALVAGKQKEEVQAIVLLVWVVVRIIVFVIAFFIFFRIVNKPEDPEFKIPWIVGMLLLPFFTSIIFLIFGNHGLRKKDGLIMEATVAAYNAHFLMGQEQREQVSDDLGRAYGAFKYINNITKLGVHSHNRYTYYKTGEEFFPEFVESLKLAKEFIFMEFFIITDGKWWSAVQEV